MGFDAEIDNSERNGVVDNLQEEIMCSICYCIFEDPMKLDCCDGHLCKKCLENVKMNSRNCPLCRKDNLTAKFSRLMVTILSQYKLFCPAQECNESVPYADFAKHKETCPVLNKKPCQQCNKFYSKDDFQEHITCFEELNKKTEADQKKIAKLESDVQEARMTTEQMITTFQSERREFRNKANNYEQKIKSLEDVLLQKLKKEKEKRNEDLEKIKHKLGKKGGAGHFFGKDNRISFDEEAVQQVLRGLEAGLTEVNFKLNCSENMEVREAGWYFRQQSWSSNYGGDGFWKMTLIKDGRRVDFKIIAEEIYVNGDVKNAQIDLRPDRNGMTKLKSKEWLFVRWNISIQK